MTRTDREYPLVGDSGGVVDHNSTNVHVFHQKSRLDVNRCRRVFHDRGSPAKAIFDNLEGMEHAQAVAKVLHQGMSFSGPRVQLDPQQKQITTRVEVYDVSYERQHLSVVTHHVKLARQGNSVVVEEFLQLRNTSDTAISSKETDEQGKSVVLNIPLPKGFKDFSALAYLVPKALSFTEEGVYDTMGVPPGDHNVVFSYNLDITSSEMDIVKKISMPTESFVLFSQLGEGVIQGPGRPDGRVTLPDGVSAEYFNFGNREPGTEIAFRIAGLGVDKAGRDTWVIVAVALGVIILLAVARLRPDKKSESADS